MAQWIDACAKDDIDAEDVMRFDHGGKTYAIYRSPEDEFFATDGLCTHETGSSRRRAGDGGDHRMPEAQRPLQLKTGEAQGRAGCVDLQTYPVRVEGDRVLIEI